MLMEITEEVLSRSSGISMTQRGGDTREGELEGGTEVYLQQYNKHRD